MIQNEKIRAVLESIESRKEETWAGLIFFIRDLLDGREMIVTPTAEHLAATTPIEAFISLCVYKSNLGLFKHYIGRPFDPDKYRLVLSSGFDSAMECFNPNRGRMWSGEAKAVMKSVLHIYIDDLIRDAERLITGMKEENSFSWYDSLDSIDQDILVAVLDSPRFCMPDRFLSFGRHSPEKTIDYIVSRVGYLHGSRLVRERVGPGSALFQGRYLTVLRGSSKYTWDDVEIGASRKMVEIVRGADEANFRMWIAEEMSPSHPMSDVILDQKRKRQIQSLCSAWKSGKTERLLFGFFGDSGTGKTMLAHAIASELRLEILRINFGPAGQDANLAILASFYLSLAKRGNLLLLFDESEDLLTKNRFRGTDNSWVKILLQDFKGIAVFTSNHEIEAAVLRRFSYIHHFKTPEIKERLSIMMAEIRKLVDAKKVSSVPSASFFKKLLERYAVSGGYYASILNLALSLNGSGRIGRKDLKDAFEAQVGDGGEARDERRQSDLKLKEVILTPDLRETAQAFIKAAKRISSLSRQDLLSGPLSALIAGPPGTGKTSLAMGLANELGMKIVTYSAGEFMSKWVGETEGMIREVFRKAEREKHVVFIDEVESLAMNRASASRSWELSHVNQLLKSLETFRGVVLFATNHQGLIDPAFSRRFLFRFAFDIPGFEERKAIWSLLLKKAGILEGVRVERLAEIKMSGGEIKNAVVQAIASDKVEDLSKIAFRIKFDRITDESRVIQMVEEDALH